jgi:hypothetical protein
MSTPGCKQRRKVSGQNLTIGLDLGDHALALRSIFARP